MCGGRLSIRVQRGYRELVGLGGVDASETEVLVLLEFLLPVLCTIVILPCIHVKFFYSLSL